MSAEIAWRPTVREGERAEDLPMKGWVGQALGTASACWSNLAGAGEFDSVRCGWVLDGLLAYLNPRLQFGPMTTWPFTDDEKAAIRAAYEALTRVGNLTATPGERGDYTPDGWQGILDRAHHDLGLVILKGRIDRDEEQQPGGVSG